MPLPLPSAAPATTAGSSRRAPERHGLSLDFYAKTCPAVDQIVANVTAARFRDHPAAGPAVLRLFHHDCFVEGCDASILIAPTAAKAGDAAARAPKVERDMEENKNLPQYGFDTVEMAKAAVESKCPGVVTCADVLALAARDFVQLAGGPYYAVKKGRKDSKVSLAGKVRGSLPRANSTVDDLLRVFASKGLGLNDLVALSGAHTIGKTSCRSLKKRWGENADFVDLLHSFCARYPEHKVDLDVISPNDFDNQYYINLQRGVGVLNSDMALVRDDPYIRNLVNGFARDQGWFFSQFSNSMSKLANLPPKLQGNDGEIRFSCSKRNNGPMAADAHQGFSASA